jgi:hypothetical protein
MWRHQLLRPGDAKGNHFRVQRISKVTNTGPKLHAGIIDQLEWRVRMGALREDQHRVSLLHEASKTTQAGIPLTGLIERVRPESQDADPCHGAYFGQIGCARHDHEISGKRRRGGCRQTPLYEMDIGKAVVRAGNDDPGARALQLICSEHNGL